MTTQTDRQKKRQYHRVTVNLTMSESSALGAAAYLKNVSPASYVRDLIRKTTRTAIPKLRNEINDSNGAAGGTGETGGSDASCGPFAAGANGNPGGRAISIFSVGGITVGTNYTVVVGQGGAAVPQNTGGPGPFAGANGSVSISWS